MTFSASSVQAMLNTRGQTVTLRRLGVGGFDVACIGKVDGAMQQPLAGGTAQFTRMVIVSNVEIAAAGWPGPPRRGDEVHVDGVKLTVTGVDTATIGTADVLHRISTSGG